MKEKPMAESRDTKEKQPAHEDQGKFHYNPGNMSGKTVEVGKDESEQQANADRIRSRHKEHDGKE
jgi:hypothetical protein